ncbi:MAG: beta-lactamase family protein [Gemmataceae bacterium]|nr:beta-lactamase family protein [Gemmataceae bacterium]
MKNPRSRLLVIVLCGLLALIPARGQPSAAQGGDPRAAVDKLFATWDRRDSPGCALAVLRDGKVLHQRGYGMADLEHEVPITPSTVFNIASVSKQFTVFLILLLAHAGLLSLDDDVRRHVPEVPDFGKVITLRHLIHHTSGLREDWSLLTLAGWRSEDVIRTQDVLDLVRRQKELNFEPGSQYLYCNTGYHLLAQTVQRVSGKSLRAHAQEKVFAPLAMTRTVFQDDHRMIIKGRASSYGPAPGGGFERILYGAGRAGPGNLHTTVEDLARWDRHFYDPRVGGAAVVAQQLRRGRLNDGKEIAYAGGLRLGQYRGLPTVEHSGSIAGYRSVLLRFPEQRFSVILLANVSNFNPAGMARRVADLYLARELQPLPPTPGLKVPVATLDACAGEYRLPLGGLLRFTRSGDDLTLRSEGRKYPLAVAGETTFLEAETGTRFAFVVPKAGAVEKVSVRAPDGERTAQRVSRPTLAAGQLGEYTGTFHSQELGVLYVASVRDGKLIVRHPRGEAVLEPLAADEFSAGPGAPFATLRYVRQGERQVSGFAVSTARARTVRFAKVEIRPRVQAPGGG